MHILTQVQTYRHTQSHTQSTCIHTYIYRFKKYKDSTCTSLMQIWGIESYRKMDRAHDCKQGIWYEKSPAAWTLHGHLGVLMIPYQNSIFFLRSGKEKILSCPHIVSLYTLPTFFLNTLGIRLIQTVPRLLNISVLCFIEKSMTRSHPGVGFWYMT